MTTTKTKPRINWFRGFLRAWMAVSALWMAFMAAAFISSGELSYTMRYLFQHEQLRIEQGTKACSKTGLRNPYLDLPLETEISRRNENDNPYAALIPNSNANQNNENKDSILDACIAEYAARSPELTLLLSAIVVPAALLLALYAMRWIFRGFRR